MLIRFLTRVVLLFLLACAGRAQAPPTEMAVKPELTCEISIPVQAPLVNGCVNGGLVIKNVSEQAIKICILVAGFRTVGKGSYSEVLCPDCWKSDSPRAEDFTKSMIVLNPKDTFTIPISIDYYSRIEYFGGRPLTISSGYSIRKQFAEEYGTWEGSIRAKPVTVTVLL